MVANRGRRIRRWSKGIFSQASTERVTPDDGTASALLSCMTSSMHLALRVAALAVVALEALLPGSAPVAGRVPTAGEVSSPAPAAVAVAASGPIATR